MAASEKFEVGQPSGLTSNSSGTLPTQGLPSMTASQPLRSWESSAFSAARTSSSLGSLCRPRVTYRPSGATTTHRRSRDRSVSNAMGGLWLGKSEPGSASLSPSNNSASQKFEVQQTMALLMKLEAELPAFSVQLPEKCADGDRGAPDQSMNSQRSALPAGKPHFLTS